MEVLIYSKQNCSFCQKAKMFLSSKGINYSEKKLNEDFTIEHLKSIFPNAKTFPVIVIDGFNIGGLRELQEYFVNNQPNDLKFLTERF